MALALQFLFEETMNLKIKPLTSGQGFILQIGLIAR